MTTFNQAKKDAGTILISVNKVSLEILQGDVLTSGARNIYPCRFIFSQDWEGVDKTAVFLTSTAHISLPLGVSGECQIPWEVLENLGQTLYVGVYGTKNGELVMPTLLAKLGEVRKGASLGEISQEPTPEIYEQILSLAASAERIAQSVREDADNGRLDGAVGPQGAVGPKGDTGAAGYSPVRGRDYWTQEDQSAIVDAVLTALPQWEGGMY